MKNWMNAELVELEISATAQGKNVSTQFDEIRVDQNGNYWAGFGSGTDSEPEVDGEVVVKP